MSDATSSATEQAGPILWHEGQPWSQQAAATRLAELDADKDFVAALLGGDIAKQQERAAFSEMSKGRQYGVTPDMPTTPEAVRQMMQERDLAIDDARLLTWEKLAGMDEQQRFESRRGLATAQQVADAKDAIDRMKKDAAFRVRVLNGDRDAVRQWLLAGRVATMQVAAEDHDWSRTT